LGHHVSFIDVGGREGGSQAWLLQCEARARKFGGSFAIFQEFACKIVHKNAIFKNFRDFAKIFCAFLSETFLPKVLGSATKVGGRGSSTGVPNCGAWFLGVTEGEERASS
jgi:hypothetical protein